MKKSTFIAVLIIFNISFYTACKKTVQEAPNTNAANDTAVEPNTTPVVNAGKDTIVLHPDMFAFLHGAFTDNDTASAKYLWTFLPGTNYYADIENPTHLHTKISRISGGKYQIQLTVTDKAGLVGRDTVEINAFHYVVTAVSQVIPLPITEGKLIGTTVLSPDRILKKEWKKISGPRASIVSPNEFTSQVIDMEEGQYIFELSVTDTANIIRKSQCSIDVIQPGGPQVIIEPSYAVIYLPTSITTLNSYIAPNQYSQSPVTKTEWTKVSGSSGFMIETPLNKDTKISGLQQGVYEIKLEAADALGNATSNYITVAVVDSLSPNQEVVIPNVRWISGGGGFACDYMEDIKLDQYIPAGKPIKKVFIRCGSDWVEVKLWGAVANTVYVYGVHSGKLIIEYCNDGCHTGPTSDIKIVY